MIHIINLGWMGKREESDMFMQLKAAKSCVKHLANILDKYLVKPHELSCVLMYSYEHHIESLIRLFHVFF